MRISVFGCGYLGAVHAACMAKLGHEVVGVDVIEAQVAALARGEAPFHEPGLPELLTEAMATGRLRFRPMPPRRRTPRCTSSASAPPRSGARTPPT